MKALAIVAAIVLALLAPATARADAVTDWNINAVTFITAPAPTAHASTLSFAMVQGAVYDAVNAIDGGYQPYLVAPPADGSESKDAAAATAAYRVLLNLFPGQQAALDALYASSLAAIGDVPAGSKAAGIAIGEAAAQAMIATRANDGRGAPFVFDIQPGPGRWRPLTPTALEPSAWVGNVEPFLLESPSQLRSSGPHALTSAEYAEEFAEVKELGSLTSTTRTADQTRAAIFWQAQPVAIYSGVMRELGKDLDTADRARLMAMVALAAADGAISCWNDKYYWYFWRPIAAIREADTDGNPATVADPAWTPLFHPTTGPGLITPAFPEHPSGHGCVSGAALNTMAEFFGTDKLSFDAFSSRFPGQPRRFARFSDCLKEIIDSRVWGGIHFRTADVQGAVIGKKVSHWLRKNYFRPAE